jgi:hypothetical protein
LPLLLSFLKAGKPLLSRAAILKILPGAEDASIEAAVALATRVSVNLEAPNARRIRAISHTKDYDGDLLGTLARADHWRQRASPAVSITTQFVVGAAQEAEGPYLLDCKVDAGENVWPMVRPGTSNADFVEDPREDSTL